MEQSLDRGIGKLLNLKGGVADIICSNIPFAKKQDVFFSAEGLLAAKPDKVRKSELKKLWNSIQYLNEKRVMFAHNPFSASDSGIAFRKVVAKKELKISVVNLTSDEVFALCDKAHEISEKILALVAEMKPYVPSLDFSDPRNSMYALLLLDEF